MKRALVTGASRGIGKAISHKLLTSGFFVSGTAYSTPFPDSLIQHKNFKGIKVDLASAAAVQKKLKSLFCSHEAPGVVINNAGISKAVKITDSDEVWLENWHKTQTLNLIIPALICKWALDYWLKEEKTGIIINITSRAAHRGDTGEFTSYASSKGGLAAFTKSIARSFGKKKITAFDIAPGFVNTDMMKEVKKTYPEDYIESELVLPEMATPEEVSQLIVFIAEGRACHLTGQTLHINSGSHIF